jgi:hypothetical protein
MDIFILPEAKRKLDLYIENHDKEISGLMRAQCVEKVFTITDVILLKQEVTGATTDLDDDDLTRIIENDPHPETLKGWWHSHVNMGVTFSKTDTDTMEGQGGDWSISIVGNKRGQYTTRLNIYWPIYVYMDCKLVETASTDDPKLATLQTAVKKAEEKLEATKAKLKEAQDAGKGLLLEEIKAEIAEKVSDKHTVTVIGGRNTCGYNPGNWNGKMPHGGKQMSKKQRKALARQQKIADPDCPGEGWTKKASGVWVKDFSKKEEKSHQQEMIDESYWRGNGYGGYGGYGGGYCGD